MSDNQEFEKEEDKLDGALPEENTLEEEVSPEDQQEPETQPEDEVKLKAKKTGHLSADEYYKKHQTMEGYKSEREFVLTGELIDLKKTVQKRDQDIEEIVKYHKDTIERQKQSLRRQLDERLAEAEAIGDVRQVRQLTEQKTGMDIQAQRDEYNKVESTRIRAEQDFLERNKYWYNDSNPELVQRCRDLDAFYSPLSRSPEETALKIEQQIKTEMSLDPRYAPLVRAKTNTQSGPSFNSSQSSVNKSVSETVNTSDSRLEAKLSSSEKAMYASLKRMASKVGQTYTVKEFIQSNQSDGEI